MSRLSKAATVGLVTGICGLVVSLSSLGNALEKNYGLHLLFKLRGARDVPSDVIIVTMDKASASHLHLPNNPAKWPRSHHARLIDNLVEKNVAVIAFDVIFSEARVPEDDNLFAERIRKAANVVLAEWIKKYPDSLPDFKAVQAGMVNYEELIPPIPLLAESAQASAPFALPRVPGNVSRYWAFKTGAGDTPTMPVVAFQIFALQVYDEFIGLLKAVSPSLAEELPVSRDVIIATKSVKKLIRTLKDHFEQNPLIAEKMLAQIKASETLSANPEKNRLLRSLIRLYQGPKSHFLNYYGPPGTIQTIPYYQILSARQEIASDLGALDLEGKVVFVGLAERLRQEHKDGYYTVFSQPNGLDLSGVEIAATAFANLLEDKHVQHLSPAKNLTMIFLWGVLVGILCILAPTIITAVSIVGLGAFYLIIADYQFKHAILWYPLVIPLFFQAPLAFFGTVLWKFFEANKERQKIRKAFEYHLPKQVVDQLAKNISHIETGSEVVYGICLTTDAEHYTTLSETMDPRDLAGFMNKYYETIFKPTRQHGGAVSDIIGDSMMALWVASRSEAALRDKACCAALDIQKAMHQFNQRSPVTLNTRIGLNSGEILLGHIGAVDHYEYRPVGDIVNTAARIEGLNKHLKTRVLVSEGVIDQLDRFLTREVGKFRLKGKAKSIVIHELLCRIEESNEEQKRSCAIFSEAMGAFRRQSWDEAIDLFRESMEAYKKDGPSHFYLQQCEKYKENPPEDNWDGTIHLGKK